MARYLRRTAFYKLNPPTVVAAPTSFVARTVQIELAASRRPGHTASRLGQPAFVAPAGANLGPQARLVPHPRQARGVHYVLRAPATLVAAAAPFVARSVQTRFSTSVKRGTEQRFFTSSLFPPEVINALPATGPSQRKLARTPRQAYVTRSKLSPPVVVGVVTVTPPFSPVSVNFDVAVSRSARKYRAGLKLRPPAVVGTAVVFRPLQTSFYDSVTRASRQRLGRTRLQAPAVVSVPSGDNPTGGIFDPNYFLIIHS